MKVLFVVDIVTDYRITFFDKINSSLNGELMVVNSSQGNNDGRPETQQKMAFPHRSLIKKKINILGFTFYYYQGLRKLLKEYRPDKVVIPGEIARLSNWLIIFNSLLYNYKIVIWACHWLPDSGIRLTIKKLIYKRLYLNAIHILSYSSKAKQSIVELIGDKVAITVCHNALDNDLLLNQKASYSSFDENLLSNKGSKTIVLYVGAMRHDKKVKMLIESYLNSDFSQDNSELWLVGDGPALQELKSLYESSDRVVFWGREIERANSFFAAADLFVLPGIGGLALNQAMYWKTPCVVYQADGTEEDLIIDAENGYYFDGSENDLTRVINKYKNDMPEQKNKLAINAHKLVNEDINLEKMVSIFLNTLSKL